MSRIVILGAGVMGSAMAFPAMDAGSEVELVGTHLDAAIIESVAGNGHHPKLNIAMPGGIRAHQIADLPKAMRSAPELLILGVSSAGIDWAIDRLAETLKGPVPILRSPRALRPMAKASSRCPSSSRAPLRSGSASHRPSWRWAAPASRGNLRRGAIPAS